MNVVGCKILNVKIGEKEKVIISNDNLPDIELIIYFDDGKFYVESKNIQIVDKSKRNNNN